jgi:predicted nucleic acid-binding protein
MSYLLDTNILLRLIQPEHPMYSLAVNAIVILHQQEASLCMTPQNLIEFWAVATRPLNVNGLAMTVETASQKVARMKGFFSLRPDHPDIFPRWEQLVTQHRVIGKQAHDTRLVAAMLVHQITHLLTFNTDDFKRFTEITPINPRHLLA